MNKTRVDDILLEMIRPKIEEIEKKFSSNQPLTQDDINTLLLKSQYNHINHLDQKLDEVTESVKELEHAFEKLEQKVVADYRRLEEKLTADYEKLEQKFDNTVAKLTADYEKLEQKLITDYERLEQKFDNSVVKVRSEFEKLEQKLTADYERLEQKYDRLEQKFESTAKELEQKIELSIQRGINKAILSLTFAIGIFMTIFKLIG